jgi:hypothetical protein
MTEPVIIIVVDPSCQPDHLGFVPSFLHTDDPRPAREQFQERYAYGGWSPQDGFTVANDRLTLHYPGDPPLKPLAVIPFRDELIVIYRHAYVGIFAEQGKTFIGVCRMD